MGLGFSVRSRTGDGVKIMCSFDASISANCAGSKSMANELSLDSADRSIEDSRSKSRTTGFVFDVVGVVVMSFDETGDGKDPLSMVVGLRGCGDVEDDTLMVVRRSIADVSVLALNKKTTKKKEKIRYY